jgi:hypothetical protein
MGAVRATSPIYLQTINLKFKIPKQKSTITHIIIKFNQIAAMHLIKKKKKCIENNYLKSNIIYFSIRKTNEKRKEIYSLIYLLF